MTSGLARTFLKGLSAAKETAEKLASEQKVCPQRLKPGSKQSSYRSAEALRHPKARARSSFSAAACKTDIENKPMIATVNRSAPSRQSRACWGPRCATQRQNQQRQMQQEQTQNQVFSRFLDSYCSRGQFQIHWEKATSK